MRQVQYSFVSSYPGALLEAVAILEAGALFFRRVFPWRLIEAEIALPRFYFFLLTFYVLVHFKEEADQCCVGKLPWHGLLVTRRSQNVVGEFWG